ncbi:sigma-70 family RNA polymerase sigma factor [Candidatus Cyanaurora vandensis]|uniref:sigma-70 family RNA polymerase sigma factor n=1 Tax=Candidatus Cyanaurora vandensis TaxID=2714958 RepID=UPI00257CA150|nr:sigma-70 family RNA polymerase sigma factor [Candidatus Cyanaurora vandensis]
MAFDNSLPQVQWFPNVLRPATPPQQMSVQELVERCQRGLQPDRATFSELLRRHQVYVDRLLFHLAPEWTDRSDLSQEVWLRVYRSIKRLQETQKFRGWLSRITTNLFYDELRKRKRQRPALSLDAPITTEEGSVDWDLPALDQGPSEVLAATEFYEKLHRAIADLPEVFRTTIVLRELEGLSYEEIAECLNISTGTVKSRIARARRRLQEELSPYLNN